MAKLGTKNPAEFFAENQNIAGFDNPGKALYTTIREFVENALDAAEAISVLPAVSLIVEEYTQTEFNAMRGMEANEVQDEDLFQSSAARKATKKLKRQGSMEMPQLTPQLTAEDSQADDFSQTTPGAGSGSADASAGKKRRRSVRGERMFYKVTCTDNGVGMPHQHVPDMLGKVLSSSKYGVRQTRGKFGLGAKMALIWSKKSTGMPIEVKTAMSTSPDNAPAFVTHCILDIDIYKNKPQVHQHVKEKNPEEWRGTSITTYVSGAWTTYKARILQYLRQLAVITPYAQLALEYKCIGQPDKDLSLTYQRQSKQMPSLAREVKHHPSSVNNLLMQQLMDKSKAQTLLAFLTGDLSCVEKKVAKRIIAELGHGLQEQTKLKSIDTKAVNRLTQVLRQVSLFKPPDGSCLSPAGEYNLRLGIMKEMAPTFVATYSDKPAVCEGHPFIVEAGLSIGGANAKVGLTVYRFANRIPLLFEGGNDVATKVAMRVNWAAYKIDIKRDTVGVFVSIVSTKIPFKGTGKEYIGDDIEELQRVVKRAVVHCCQQMKVHMVKKNALRDQRERKKVLTKYIPDAARAVFGMIESMNHDGDSEGEGLRSRLSKQLREGKLTEEVLSAKLREAVERHDATALEEEQARTSKGRGGHDRVDLEVVARVFGGRDKHLLMPLLCHADGVLSLKLFTGVLQQPGAPALSA
ncbi:unnamed protein product [Chrysoparadoxa australica]